MRAVVVDDDVVAGDGDAAADAGARASAADIHSGSPVAASQAFSRRLVDVVDDAVGEGDVAALHRHAGELGAPALGAVVGVEGVQDAGVGGDVERLAVGGDAGEVAAEERHGDEQLAVPDPLHRLGVEDVQPARLLRGRAQQAAVGVAPQRRADAEVDVELAAGRRRAVDAGVDPRRVADRLADGVVVAGDAVGRALEGADDLAERRAGRGRGRA